MGPGASKTLIRHASEQERIGLADQIVLIGAHGFVVDLPDPIHFSVWSRDEAVKGDPCGGNNFSHALLLLEGKLSGRRPDAVFVSIGVGELCPFAPGFGAQLLGKRDTTSFERCTGCFNVVSVQDIAGEAGFVAAALAAQAEHDVGLCSWRSHFEPALSFAHGLIIDLLKTQRVDVEVQGFILVAHANADGANFCEHEYLLVCYLPPAAAGKRGECNEG